MSLEKFHKPKAESKIDTIPNPELTSVESEINLEKSKISAALEQTNNALKQVDQRKLNPEHASLFLELKDHFEKTKEVAIAMATGTVSSAVLVSAPIVMGAELLNHPLIAQNAFRGATALQGPGAMAAALSALMALGWSVEYLKNHKQNSMSFAEYVKDHENKAAANEITNLNFDGDGHGNGIFGDVIG